MHDFLPKPAARDTWKSPLPFRANGLDMSSPALPIFRKASCACGGGCPACSSGLKVSHPNDAAEVEADRVADRIMRMPADRISPVDTVTPSKTKIHRKCNTCEDVERPVLRKALPASGGHVRSRAPGHVGEALNSGGRPLDRETRGFFEPRLGYDLGGVRIHTGAAAERSALAVDAKAYTLGSDIVFNRDQFRPDTESGKHLLAHELAHTVQHFGSQMSATVYRTPGSDRARAKVVAAMEALKTKYGLKEVSEENNVTWSESELKNVDVAFSKMTKEELALLKGSYLVRSDKHILKHKGKDIKLAGTTTDTTIRLYDLAFGSGRNETVRVTLHEAGHLIQNQTVRRVKELLPKSPVGNDLEIARINLEEARNKVPRYLSGDGSAELGQLSNSMAQVSAAAGAIVQDENADQNAIDALNMARGMAAGDRANIEKYKTKDAAVKMIEAYARLLEWSYAVERWKDERDKVLGPRSKLTEFVDIVKKNNLARKGFAPFTPYVASFWPDDPKEFYAESYAVWRKNPDYLKDHAEPLYKWFKSGGHLPPPIKVETFRETASRHAPALSELANEVEATFKPLVLEPQTP